MRTYNFKCSICKEQHQFFTGRMTFGTPEEVLASKNMENPHQSITIVDSELVYIKGIIKIPVYDINDGFILENWMQVTVDDWKKLANGEKNLQGRLLYTVDIFQLSENMEWRLGYDERHEEFVFLAKEDDLRILSWQTDGMPLAEVESYFAQLIHKEPSPADETTTTSKLEDAAEFLLAKDSDVYVHALLDNNIIFQLLDARGLELLDAKNPGIGLDIPIDESVEDKFRDQILSFAKLSAYSSDVVNGIRLYQFNYGIDIDELRKDIEIIAKECYGVDSTKIKYELNDMIKLQGKD